MRSAQDIFLLVGVPASGKSWVMKRAAQSYECIAHDDFIGNDQTYFDAIVKAADTSEKPLLIETPFSMSKIMTPLEERGFKVTPLFLIESEEKLHERWAERDTLNSARMGHLTRQKTYQSRTSLYRSFSGDSYDVLNHLNLLAAERELYAR